MRHPKGGDQNAKIQIQTDPRGGHPQVEKHVPTGAETPDAIPQKPAVLLPHPCPPPALEDGHALHDHGLAGGQKMQGGDDRKRAV